MINFCFRVDASTEVGMGHLIESISLAESLTKSVECDIVFLIRNYLPAVNILRRKGYQVQILRRDIKEEDEISQIDQAIKKFETEVLICDLLNKDNGYFRKLKSIAKRTVVILDDAKQRAVNADIVVNFNIVQKEEFYQKLPAGGTIYCIGPKYMLLSEELHNEWKKEKVIPQTCRTIFVNQGGGDLFGLTAKIIRALELLNLKQKIIVVAGPSMSQEHRRELESLKPGLKNCYQFEWSITQEQMHQFMSESDLAITAGGNTIYELAVFGVSSITVCQQEEQNTVAQEFAQRQAIVNLGIGTNISPDLIANSVKELLHDRTQRISLSKNAKRISDGKGCRRVAEIIIHSMNQKHDF